MKSKDKIRTNTIKSILSDISYKDKENTNTTTDLIAVLQKSLKMRNQSIQEYKNAGRSDLAKQEESESEIISEYLPKALSDKEVSEIVKNVILKIDAKNVKEMGKIMKECLQEINGGATKKQISDQIKTFFEKNQIKI
ncbi:hypothetical protein HDU92_006481 [Lobulomyces angularis]|nr:hypothetical protein HDU92_006481 [Lobulomyces angularis]